MPKQFCYLSLVHGQPVISCFLHTQPTALVGSWSILQGVVYQGQQHTWCRTPSFRNTLGTCGLKAGHQLKPSCGGSTSHSSAQSPKAKPVGQAASSPPVGGSSSTDVVVMVTVVSIMGSWEVEKLTKTIISNHWFTTRTIHKAMLLHRPCRKRSQGVKDRRHWYTGFYIWSDVIARWRIGSLSLQTKICCITSWLPAAKLPWSWSWLWPWWWSSWVWSCSPSSWLWSSSCSPWQCWIQRAFLGSNVFPQHTFFSWLQNATAFCTWDQDWQTCMAEIRHLPWRYGLYESIESISRSPKIDCFLGSGGIMEPVAGVADILQQLFL